MGGTISEFELLEGEMVSKPDDENGNFGNTEICDLGVRFTTEKGNTTFETRLESNGCYGGELSVVEVGQLEDGSTATAHTTDEGAEVHTKYNIWNREKCAEVPTTYIQYFKPIKDF